MWPLTVRPSFQASHGLRAWLHFAPQWFIMAFEIVLIVALAVLAANGKLRQFKTSFVGLFSVATLLFIEVCRVWLPIEAGAELVGGQVSGGQTTPCSPSRSTQLDPSFSLGL